MSLEASVHRLREEHGLLSFGPSLSCAIPSKETWQKLELICRYIGDAKYGKLVGTDQFGNKYYENTTYGEEVPGGCLALFRESDDRRPSCSSEGCRYVRHRGKCRASECLIVEVIGAWNWVRKSCLVKVVWEATVVPP